MNNAATAGVRGRRARAATSDTEIGRVNWWEVRRQGVVPEKLLGNIVRVTAYERRR